ncbi:MAG: HlyD family efflux transporter periplasmic adaptor subunit [Magnetococcales bacterium]|nr:HlyD family efflux transporter periplasmic adaptor subunit [Magnetococcales bacterium]
MTAIAAMAGGAPEQPVILPPLREDLGLFPGPVQPDGAPTWTIHDPIRNRFFRISRVAFELLARWMPTDGAIVLAQTRAETGLMVSEQDLKGLIQFLQVNALLLRMDADGPAYMKFIADKMKPPFWTWLLQNYLFLRIPLFRPESVLRAMMPTVRVLYTREALWVFVMLGMLGAFLTSRQWEAYSNTFMHFFSWDGLVWWVIALTVSKMVHEFGHAFTAYRFGCKVSTMGVALLVLWPVMYTETSDSWKLASKHQRMAIASAGVVAELGLAVIALLVWHLTPEGPIHSAAFLLSSVTWIMTLGINLNPFMRFDGYYLVSDALGVENLHSRGFELARWFIRSWLLGLAVPPPERFPPKLQRGLILFALGTWMYRLLIFISIAWLVYEFFFKVLGIFLFIVEIWWFIFRPVVREMAQWWQVRSMISWNRRLVVHGGVWLIVIALMVVPWHYAMELPAVMLARETAMVYAESPARINTIHVEAGAVVQVGDPLITLENPGLENMLAQAQTRVDLAKLRLSRTTASIEERSLLPVLQRALASEQAQLLALQRQKNRLVLMAPISGTVSEFSHGLHAGRWIDETVALVEIVNRRKGVVEAYVEEADLHRLNLDANGLFYADDPALSVRPCRVVSIADHNARSLEFPVLASLYNGPVPVHPPRESGGVLVPVRGIYRVGFEIGDATAPGQQRSGVVRVEAESRSGIVWLWERVMTLLIRESGF